MANFSPGNEDLCFTCHLMQECTDAGKLPPCLGVIEPVQQTTNTGSPKLPQFIEAMNELPESIIGSIDDKDYMRGAKHMYEFIERQLRAGA